MKIFLFFTYVILFSEIVLFVGADEFEEEIKVSLIKAEQALIQDTEFSYNRVIKSELPIQTDLYTMAHFLMYSDKFTQPFPHKLRQNIEQYFIKDQDNALVPWRIEGCLFPKVIIGLKTEEQLDSRKQMIITQLAWGQKYFNQDVFNECFSVHIDRTYGSNANTIPVGQEFTCVASIENIAKYFYALLRYDYNLKPWNAFLIMPSIKMLNDFHPADDWPYMWRTFIEEPWIIYVKKMTSNKIKVWPGELEVVSDQLYQRVCEALRKKYYNNQKSQHQLKDDVFVETFNGDLLAALVLIGDADDPNLKPLVQRLIQIQKPDGHWGHDGYGKNGIAYNGGFVWASPTYGNHWGLYCYLHRDDKDSLCF